MTNQTPPAVIPDTDPTEAFEEVRRESQRAALIAMRVAAKRAAAMRNRLLAKRARYDTRAWQVKRRERTRRLIELGGVVAKAGLVELTARSRLPWP